ncbi:MAG: hypothetical protein A2Z83_07845 [Omnitrophica bacterium GWA2_52_8]|nr:MAG: hypothetical protein A2Z83_07845 [Omnitrophica bacterium GWA2_52_8]
MRKLNIDAGSIAASIQIIRNERVLLDRDLAKMYGVKVKTLIQAAKRNGDRFPDDFMFQLAWNEIENPRSQNVTLRPGQNIKYRPYAFTEQGIAMLSGILRSKPAVRVNVAIMRTFVKLRRLLSANKELALQLRNLENKVEKHDEEIRTIFSAIRQLMAVAQGKPKRRIGFHSTESRGHAI